mmetsp:Transcript_90514/g.256367  ORF Transcript_90514/g.256367 Transcript_90514/m.256367 type:complete len:506 (+) Transcript_90514:70-1587(+)
MAADDDAAEVRRRGARSETPAREEPKAGKKAGPKGKLDIEAKRSELAAARALIGLRRTPLLATRLALVWTAEFAVRAVKRVLRSPLTWLLAVPLAVAWGALKTVLAPDLFAPPVCGDKDAGVLWWVELAGKEVLWWVILGILSSVGFGTGLHSGLMFLFPHVMQVVGAAEACQTSSGLVAWYQHPCKLDCSTTRGPKDGSTVTVLRLWLLVTVQCMLWGFGTAIGELPPYLVSKAARLAGSKDTDFEAELAEARKSKDVFSRMKIWTIDFTEKHGFLGVFLLASWPNAAFDMCGMCCGYVLMPFWTFLIATCCGKGIVKVNLQAVVFVILFGSTFFQWLLSGLESFNGALQGAIGRDLRLRELVEGLRSKLIRQFEQQSRFAPEKLFEGRGDRLNLAAIEQVYSKHDDKQAVARRVLQEWDANSDGGVSVAELRTAASRTDGKVSLSSLDPGKGTSALSMLWELLIVGLVLFFLFSVIEQLARTKQQELDDAELERLEKDQQKKE